MKHSYNLVPYRLLRQESKLFAHLQLWRPSPGLMPRVAALAPNIDKLPRQSHDARKLLADAITYGLSDGARVQIDRLVSEVRPRRRLNGLVPVCKPRVGRDEET